jgi:hypothetical protein
MKTIDDVIDRIHELYVGIDRKDPELRAAIESYAATREREAVEREREEIATWAQRSSWYEQNHDDPDDIANAIRARGREVKP